jgi:hypothetical protein
MRAVCFVLHASPAALPLPPPPLNALPQAAQAHLLCRAAENFLRQQGLLHAFSSCASLPMVLCGDFNSLPFKRHSDAFDTGGCCRQ